MMTARKFYKTIISIEVLSETPIPDGMNLGTVIQEGQTGEYSMRVLDYKKTKLNGKQAAIALSAHGSSPEFFLLTEKGEDNLQC